MNVVVKSTEFGITMTRDGTPDQLFYKDPEEDILFGDTVFPTIKWG